MLPMLLAREFNQLLASICKGICVRHKAQGAASFGRYLRGQEQCQSCQIFLEWHGGWCPCCVTKLRTSSRNWKYRSKSKVKRTESNHANDIRTEVCLDCDFLLCCLYDFQPSRGKTIASVYSVRPTTSATVSMPVRWEELDNISPKDFTLLTVPNIMRRKSDPWRGVFENKQDMNSVLSSIKK